MKRVYWDACAWLGLINREDDRFPVLRYYIEQAQQGKVEIWTSAFTLAEVFKRRCKEKNEVLDSSKDDAFEDYLSQPFIKMVAVDREIGTWARRLLRKFPKLKKPQDAIHLATAARHNIDEFHTFDDENLIPLNGQIDRLDGSKLVIGRPVLPPADTSGPLFELMDGDETESKAAGQQDEAR